jgi:membrane-bound lytic murein transglycosylase D
MYKIRCQIGQKDRFREGLIRSGAFIDEMKQIFHSYGLPMDLVYLPHVESSFNPKAYSKFGAAGIWQFVREAGKRYMTVGYAMDERWDPIRSSEAAAQLLKRSYEKFGSWPLAMIHLNCRFG